MYYPGQFRGGSKIDKIDDETQRQRHNEGSGQHPGRANAYNANSRAPGRVARGLERVARGLERVAAIEAAATARPLARLGAATDGSTDKRKGRPKANLRPEEAV